MSDPGSGATVYDEVGGLPFFEALVDRFYDGVARDPELLGVYPTPVARMARIAMTSHGSAESGPARPTPRATPLNTASAPR